MRREQAAAVTAGLALLTLVTSPLWAFLLGRRLR